MKIIKKAREARRELEQIKCLLKTAQISYEGAKTKAKNPLKDLNAGMAQISKQHGFKHRQVVFAGFFR